MTGKPTMATYRAPALHPWSLTSSGAVALFTAPFSAAAAPPHPREAANAVLPGVVVWWMTLVSKRALTFPSKHDLHGFSWKCACHHAAARGRALTLRMRLSTSLVCRLVVVVITPLRSRGHFRWCVCDGGALEPHQMGPVGLGMLVVAHRCCDAEIVCGSHPPSSPFEITPDSTPSLPFSEDADGVYYTTFPLP
jgi:hypothetical protein